MSPITKLFLAFRIVLLALGYNNRDSVIADMCAFNKKKSHLSFQVIRLSQLF